MTSSVRSAGSVGADVDVGQDRAGRAEKTMMRSARNTASSTSWVTKMTVLRSARLELPQLQLQAFARQRVERAERLVHQQHAEPAASVRAMATRWRMPPEMRLRIGVGEVGVSPTRSR